MNDPRNHLLFTEPHSIEEMERVRPVPERKLVGNISARELFLVSALIGAAIALSTIVFLALADQEEAHALPYPAYDSCGR